MCRRSDDPRFSGPQHHATKAAPDGRRWRVCRRRHGAQAGSRSSALTGKGESRLRRQRPQRDPAGCSTPGNGRWRRDDVCYSGGPPPHPPNSPLPISCAAGGPHHYGPAGAEADLFWAPRLLSTNSVHWRAAAVASSRCAPLPDEGTRRGRHTDYDRPAGRRQGPIFYGDE
jgi:hypothetical protein